MVKATRKMSQRTRLILLGVCIGGLTYISGGGLLSMLYVPDAVIIAWWFGLMVVSLVEMA